jgi:hypothetical protein
VTIFYESDDVIVHHGDCLDVLREMKADSVDAICTDPPYNLSDSRKRDGDCLRRILADSPLPHLDDRDAERPERDYLSVPRSGGTPLRGVDGAIGIDGGVGVPERALHLDGATVVEPEVEARDVPPAGPSDGDLPDVADTETVELLGDYVLDPADRGDAPFCDGTCSCFTEPRAGFIAVRVTLPGTPSGDLSRDLSRDLFGGWGTGDADVRNGDDTRGETGGPSGVVALAGAVRHAVLRLDLAGRSGELLPADADETHPLFTLRRAHPVGARTGASGLTPVGEPARIGVVDGIAHWALALHLPWHALKVSRTTAGFMGRTWDGWDSPAAFQRWCAAWAVECLRVLKPGGHMLAFGGSRTWHRLACAVEDAGFEIRDSIAWLQGAGFPKSLDVSKAIDKAAGAQRKVVGTKIGQPGYSLTDGNGDHRTYSRGLGNTGSGEAECAITEPATDDARAWQGWGTALKPSHEPVVHAVKPLDNRGILAVIGSHLDRLESEWQAQAAARPTPTGAVGGSSDRTATYPSESMAANGSNTVSSWRACWDELCSALSTSTTEITSSTTTDLRTLSSCLSRLTPANMLTSRTSPHGLTSIASAADALFASVVCGLRATLALSATEPATGSTQPGPQGAAESGSPAFEPIVVGRKPLAGTVAANVLAHGTGALNIDGCRVGTPAPSLASGRGTARSGGIMGVSTPRDGWENTASGRWPANVLLSHAEGCRPVGTVVENVGGGEASSVSSAFTGGGYEPGDGFVGKRVASTVWECVPGCPVGELDRQSGTSRDGVASGMRAGFRSDGLVGGTPDGAGGYVHPPQGYGGAGGASRFFPTFRYEPKAPTSERPRVGAVTCACTTVKPWPSPQRDTTGSVSVDDKSWSTSTSGSSITDGSSRPATTSITSTATSSTTPSGTSDLSAAPSTSAFTAGARSETESGGSPAGSAVSSSPSVATTGTSAERDGRSTDDAAPVTSPRSASVSSACDVCGLPKAGDSGVGQDVAHPT